MIRFRYYDANYEWYWLIDDVTVIAGNTAQANKTLTVTLAGSGTGTVTSSPAGINCTTGTCNANYTSGTSVTLIPTPGDSSTFAGWSGACTIGSGNCVVTMDAAKSATATFNVPDNVRIGGIAYGSLAAAYNAATAGSDIKGKTMTFIEDLLLGRGISFRLLGGYDGTFTNQTGYTTIDGTVTLKGAGTVTVDRVIIK